MVRLFSIQLLLLRHANNASLLFTVGSSLSHLVKRDLGQGHSICQGWRRRSNTSTRSAIGKRRSTMRSTPMWRDLSPRSPNFKPRLISGEVLCPQGIVGGSTPYRELSKQIKLPREQGPSGWMKRKHYLPRPRKSCIRTSPIAPLRKRPG